ncbi:hypothetical protein RCL1_002775 [Eukaryota sp. TZLM3-RCL]
MTMDPLKLPTSNYHINIPILRSLSTNSITTFLEDFDAYKSHTTCVLSNFISKTVLQILYLWHPESKNDEEKMKEVLDAKCLYSEEQYDLLEETLNSIAMNLSIQDAVERFSSYLLRFMKVKERASRIDVKDEYYLCKFVDGSRQVIEFLMNGDPTACIRSHVPCQQFKYITSNDCDH